MSTASYQINSCKRDEWDNDEASEWSHGKKKHVQNTLGQEEEVMNVVKANRHQLTEDVRCSLERVIRIGATCIAEINGRFFLLVEIEIGVAGEEIEQVIVIRITAAQAQALLRAGVERCTIVTEIPTSRAGVEVELICVFVVGNFAFLVFDVENNFDRLVLVRVPLCTVI